MRPRFVAASAVVEEGAAVGQGTSVWDLTQVRAGAVVGADCTIGRNVFIDADVVVGDRCKIQNNVLVYAPARLGDGVFLGPGVILTNDRVPRAVDSVGRLKDGAGWTSSAVVVESGASVGAGATLVAGVTIGRWAMVGAGAVVTRSVPAYALVVGNPARRIGWVGTSGTRLRAESQSVLVCPDTGARFALHGDHIEELS
jgi:acetyltransferase-like isoleucine patch superfamily enzyme